MILVDGRAAAWIGRGDRQLVVAIPDDEPERSRIGRAMARELVAIAHRAPEGRRGWLIEEINGKPAATIRRVISSSKPASRRRAWACSSACRGAPLATQGDDELPMPEGDTIFRAARTMHRALAGHAVTKFETAYAHLDRVNVDTPIAGRIIEKCESAGKHHLIVFSGDLILRTHMRMNGSWHFYRHGERWWRGPQAMRVRIDTADWVAVAFNVPVAEFVTSKQLATRDPVAQLGPDLLGSRVRS